MQGVGKELKYKINEGKQTKPASLFQSGPLTSNATAHKLLRFSIFTLLYTIRNRLLDFYRRPAHLDMLRQALFGRLRERSAEDIVDKIFFRPGTETLQSRRLHQFDNDVGSI